jgi:hypothetical protein
MKEVAIIKKFSPCVLKRLGCSLALGLLVTFFLGCAHQGKEVAQVQVKEGFYARRIAILPFQRVLSDKKEETVVRCPVCGSLFRTDWPDHLSEKNVENIFLKYLQKYSRIEVIPADKASGIYNRISVESLKVNLEEIIQKIGHELTADGVVVGYVYRYTQRKGYAYSVEQPASVAFDIHLIRVGDGATIWKGTFDETQCSLLENVLQVTSFFKEGAKWLTAEELTQRGMEEIFKTFPVGP